MFCFLLWKSKEIILICVGHTSKSASIISSWVPFRSGHTVIKRPSGEIIPRFELRFEDIEHSKSSPMMPSAFSTCASTQQQNYDSPSIQQSIQCAQQLPSKRVEDVHTASSALNASSLLPPPTKFCRKATCLERAAAREKSKVSEMIMHAQRKDIYTSHRQYIHSLLLQTESFNSSSSDDAWAACESLFK